QIKFWDIRARRDEPVETSVPPYTPSGRIYGFVNMTLDPSGSRIYAGSKDNTIHEYATTSLSSPLRQFSSATLAIDNFYIKAAVSPDGCTLACGSSSGDHSVQLFDLTHGGERRAPVLLKGHELGVTALDWCKRDYEQLASCSDEQVVRIWNVRHARNATEFESGKPEEDEACLKHLVGRSEKGRVVERQSRVLEKPVEIAPAQHPSPAPPVTDTLNRERLIISPETVLATSTPNTPTTAHTQTHTTPSLAASPLPLLTHDRHATLTNAEVLESPVHLHKTEVGGSSSSTPSARRVRGTPGSARNTPIQTSLNKYFTVKPKKEVVLAPVGVAEKGDDEFVGEELEILDVNSGRVVGHSMEIPGEMEPVVEVGRLERDPDVQAVSESADAEVAASMDDRLLNPPMKHDTQPSSLPTEPISEPQPPASSLQCFQSPKPKPRQHLAETRPKQGTFEPPNTSPAGSSCPAPTMSRKPSLRFVSSLSASISTDTPPPRGLVRSLSTGSSLPSNRCSGSGVPMTRSGSSNRSVLGVCSNTNSTTGPLMTRNASTHRSMKSADTLSGACNHAENRKEGVAMTSGSRSAAMGPIDSSPRHANQPPGSIAVVAGIGKRRYSEIIVSNSPVASTCAGMRAPEGTESKKRRIKVHSKHGDAIRCEAESGDACDLMALVEDALGTSFVPDRRALSLQRAVTLDSGLLQTRCEMDTRSVDPNIPPPMNDKHAPSETEYGTCGCGCPMLDSETCHCVRYTSTMETSYIGKDGTPAALRRSVSDLVEIGVEQENVCPYHYAEWGLM
ncbi:hypothetical protein HDU98_004066, partial [Podochytrium sp. JEL0797]